jgi:hypothetical protein
MGIITDLLSGVALPKMVRVKQVFPATEISDVAGTVKTQLRRPQIANRVKPGKRIAVGVGSRGIAEIVCIVQATISELKEMGAEPFIVPAMGSHGGATAQGQIKLLASLGITEASAGCPILSSLDVVELGVMKNGLAVLMDKNAYEADGIVVINRVKAHNAFSGSIESGLAKMITIGLGKQKGADAAHTLGFKYMAEFVPEIAEVKLRKLPFLFGVASVENAYDRPAKIVAIPAEEILETEPKLLAESKANMPKLLLQPLDILVVDQQGKEFSGGGMDPYITGRAPTTYLDLGPTATRVVALDLTDYSHGNCCGSGMADITTRRMFNKIDFEETYVNVLTSTVTNTARIGLIFDSDRLAIQAAIKTCNVLDSARIRMARIANTLHVGEIYVSESMLEDARKHPNIIIAGDPEPWVFDDAGNLTDIGRWPVHTAEPATVPVSAG